jgi:hypothetical protein
MDMGLLFCCAVAHTTSKLNFGLLSKHRTYLRTELGFNISVTVEGNSFRTYHLTPISDPKPIFNSNDDMINDFNTC